MEHIHQPRGSCCDRGNLDALKNPRAAADDGSKMRPVPRHDVAQAPARPVTQRQRARKLRNDSMRKNRRDFFEKTGLKNRTQLASLMKYSDAAPEVK